MLVPSDTSPDVERRMHEAYRRMSPARKWANLVQDHRFARSLHAAGVRHRHPGASRGVIQADWITQVWDAACPIPIPEGIMEPVEQDFQPVLRFVVDTLNRLLIPYAIGGSVASSLHGVNRQTRDADLTVEPFPGREDAFVAAFDPAEFYLSPDSVRDALRNHSTFNILHPATGYKIDVFVRKDDPFERTALARRMSFPVAGMTGGAVLLHTPEDTVLFKLRWYRLGGGTSDRQWGDVLGVMRTQAGRLDAAYLDDWAAHLGVKDLLDRVRRES